MTMMVQYPSVPISLTIREIARLQNTTMTRAESIPNKN